MTVAGPGNDPRQPDRAAIVAPWQRFAGHGDPPIPIGEPDDDDALGDDDDEDDEDEDDYDDEE